MNYLKITLWLGALCTSLAWAQSPAPSSPSSLSAKGIHTLDSLFEQVEAHQAAMGSISLWQNGVEVYHRSLGMAAFEPRVKATPHTKYRMGSISKVYTAVLTLQMIENGSLQYHTPLAQFYPELPGAHSITIRHLLRHRSGLFNITAAPDYEEWMQKPITEKEMLEKIKAYESQFAPGSTFQYSNSNYILLTYILEKVSGQSYRHLLKSRIAQPLQLTHTYPTDTLLPQKDQALSFQKFGSWQRSSITHGSVPGGAGNLLATPSEINAFLHALMQGKLLKAASLDSMQTMIDGYGMGLLTVPFMEKRGYGHTGGIDNFRSQAFYFPKDQLSYTFLTNGLQYPLNDLSVAVLSIYFQREFTWPEFTEEVSLTPAQIESYTGLYSKEGFPLKITISEVQGSLKAQGTGQPAFPLTATDEHTFTFKPARVTITFHPDKGELVLLQNGMEYRMQKEK